MVPHLENEEDSDDFGDIEDEDLMLAESSAPPLTNSNIKRTTPADFGDESTTKKLKAAEDPEAVFLAESLLQKIWGFRKFRLKQEAAIARLITGGSAAVVFPTGGGKSLVYQIPALAFDDYDELCGRTPGKGITLVVSPLIALMKVVTIISFRMTQAHISCQDQVDALTKRGVAAAAMDSSQTRDSWLDTCDKLRRGELKLL